MCVFDISAVDTDAAYYDGRHPRKILSQNKQRKKGKYIEAFLEQGCHFTPLVFSVDGLMGEYTKEETNKMATTLWTKRYI